MNDVIKANDVTMSNDVTTANDVTASNDAKTSLFLISEEHKDLYDFRLVRK